MRLRTVIALLVTALAFGGPTFGKPNQVTKQPNDARVTKESGCATLNLGDQDVTFKVGRDQRSIRVHVPPGTERGKRYPLVIVLHGGGMAGGTAIQKPSKMDEVADAHGFITAYPNGSGKVLWGYTWNGGECCGKAMEQKADDLGYIAGMIDTMVGGGCIDPKRVYVTGVSNGGMMAHHVGCDLANKVAAVAPIAGTLMDSSCSPSRHVSVFMLHGTGDTHIPYKGGGDFKGAGAKHAFPSVDDTLKTWLKIDRCGAEHTTSYQKGDTTCILYDNCAGGSAVALCTVKGGGHTWPGGATYLDWWIGKTTQDISNEEMWKFFAAHPMP
jgi:polyhydroxybutyrate depolymerase